MRAVVLPRFGARDLLELREVERPEPGPDEVLVRVVASGTNPVDAKLRENGSWAGLAPPVILGYDAAGVVEEVGVGVTEFEPGDEVFYMPPIHGNDRGTYAEYNVVAAELVAAKPANLSFVEAAAIPLAGGTAWEAVIRRLQPRPHETVLVQGGAGGVGSFAVQFAGRTGARVLASAGPENQDTLRELGADVAIDYRTEDPADVALEETDGEGVDAVFEVAGDRMVGRSLPGVRPFGRIATILPPGGDLGSLSRKNVTLYGVFVTRERDRLEEMRPLFERGQVAPLVEEVLPLAEVARAHERLESGHGRGKIVLEIGV